MTKKRFKMSMAALGLLGAFFMVLIAVLLAPTLASANKDGGAPHHHDAMPDVGYPHGGPGGASHGFTENWNESGHDHGHAFDTPFCVDGGVYPCADLGGADDAFGPPDGFENGFSGGGNPHGDDASNGNGRYSPNFWGGGGGGPGGGAGEGGHDGDKACTKESDKPDSEKTCDDSEQDGDKTKPGDTEVPLLTLTPPDDDQHSDFVDPNFGDNDPNGGKDPEDGPQDGPKGDIPPVTELTEVPEPLTLSLFAVGLVGAASLRRRSRNS